MMRGSYCLYSQRGPLKQKQRKKKESGPAEQASTGAKTGAKGKETKNFSCSSHNSSLRGVSRAVKMLERN
eukprot:g25665.t1